MTLFVSQLPRRPAATFLLAMTAALVPTTVPTPASARTAKKKSFTRKGKLPHSKGGGYFLQFKGEGSWNVKYNSVQSGNNLTDTYNRSASSTYKWNLKSAEPINVPWPCKVGTSNLCASIIGGALDKGTQSITYSLTDEHISSVEPAQSVGCSGSAGLDSKTAQPRSALFGTAIGITGTKGGSVVAATLDKSSTWPFLGSTNPADWISGATCHGLDGRDDWIPGGVGATLPSAQAPDFFDFKGPTVPVSILTASQSITIPVSGPKAGNEPKCGGEIVEGTTCSATGSWSGAVVLTRAR